MLESLDLGIGHDAQRFGDQKLDQYMAKLTWCEFNLQAERS